jgi:uncharacterized protein YbjT (DUF2867 family)
MGLTLVTGGTGHLGEALVRELEGRGKRLRLLTRRPRPDADTDWALGDLATGEGLAEALQGVDAVIHAATLSPIARRGGMALSDLFSSPSTVDVDGTRRLLEAAGAAKVDHFLFVSIAGLEHSPLPYSKVKLAGERLVRESSLPWSVVRATPFYYLLADLLDGLRGWPLWPLPNAVCNPVDVTDVAAYLADCLDAGPSGMCHPIGGPELMPLPDYARQFQEARGARRPILPLPVSKKTALGIGVADEPDARRGRVTWRDWLARHDVHDGAGTKARSGP